MLMLVSLVILLIAVHFDIKLLMSIAFIVSVVGSGFSISNVISRLTIMHKSIHTWILLILGGLCININNVLITCIGCILLCFSSGLLVDKILPTKNN